MASGFGTMPPKQDLATSLMDGVLKGWLIRRSEKMQQQQLAQRHEQNLGYLQEQDRLARGRTADDRAYEKGQAGIQAQRSAFDVMLESVRAGGIPDDNFYQQATQASGLPPDMVRSIIDTARRGYEATAGQKEAERQADYQRATDVARIGAESRETVAGMGDNDPKKVDATARKFTSIMAGWQKRQDAFDKSAADRPNDPALAKGAGGVPQAPEGWELGDDMYRELVAEEMAKSDVPRQSQAENIVRGHFYATELAAEFGIDPLEPLDSSVLARIGVKGAETLSDLVSLMVSEEGKKRPITMSEARQLLKKYQQAAQMGQFGQAYRGALGAK